MRFHVLGVPHTVSSKEFSPCAFTQKVVKFCKMMKARGHTIIHYGHEESVVDCDEHVTVLSSKDWAVSYGNYDWRNNFFKFNLNDYAYQTFFHNAIHEVGRRKQKNDFILAFWGHGVKPVCDAHPDLLVVEPGIGYVHGIWAPWKVFESYAMLHAYNGLVGMDSCVPAWNNVVIPNYFDPEDFLFKEKKEDYFLFVGRVYEGKGLYQAIEITQSLNIKLIVAGQKDDNIYFPPHVSYIGYANVEKRKHLMANAKCALIPSLYIEPFAGVQVEMMLSGTPTITTDWGAFAENNIHGVTGYRCRTFEEFCWAAKNIDNIDPKKCRKWGENFLFDKVAPMYEAYFENVLHAACGAGWYGFRGINNLDYLKKDLPF